MNDSRNKSQFGSQNGNLTKKLQEWYKQFKPATKCTNDLLQILNDEGFDIPNSMNNLIRTAKKKSKLSHADTAADTEIDTDKTTATIDNSNMDVDNFDDFQNDTIDDSWPSTEDISDIVRVVVKTEICKEVDANVLTDIQEKQKYLNAQINYLMREVAIINVRLAESITVENVIEKTAYMFPIGNISDLVEFEKSLNNNNTEIQISNMKKVIRNDPMNKSLSRILSKHIIIEHNYEGKQGKLALNAYPKFVNLLFKSYGDFESFSEFVYEFKRSLKCIKNRVHKTNCLNRKSITNSAPDPLEIDTKSIKTSNYNSGYNYYN